MLDTAVPVANEESPRLEPEAFARYWSAGRKGTSFSGLEGFALHLAETPQGRPIEISECRCLEAMGEHAREEPSRKMGGSEPAQMVSPLQTKLVDVEAGKTRDRGLEPLAFRRQWRWRD